MVSPTGQTEKRREMKRMKARRKNSFKRKPTPKFPVQPEGYDPKAPDAKPSSG